MQITESMSSNSQTFVETTFDKNVSSNSNSKFENRNFFTRIFGTKEFIFTFWKLLLPSLIWGLITSLVPLLFNVFASEFFQNGSSGNMYLAIDYTYGVFSTINSLATVFLFAVFPVVGNFVTRGHFHMVRQTIRWAIYIGVCVSLILLIFEQAFASDMMNLMVWDNAQSGNQTTLSVNLLRFMSFISFFYLWSWIYVPTLSSIKNTKAIFYSAILAFVFFIISTPVYLHFLTLHQTSANTTELTDNASIGLGAIYLAYFIIQPLYLYFYCHFIDSIRRTWYKMFKGFYDKHPELLRNEHYEKELLFMREYNVSFELIKRIFALSWCIILDQLLFCIVSVVQLVFIINYGGQLVDSISVNLNGSNAYLAASNYYKDITSIAFELNTFLFGIFNAFTIAPQYFVANELGRNNKQKALHNEYLCINWSIVIGAVFLVIMFICSVTLNSAFFPETANTETFFDATGSTPWYQIYINETSSAYVTYTNLYQASTNIMYIFSGFMIINTACSMMFFVLIEGGSKLTALGDSFVQIIFTIVLAVLYVVHYDNIYWYYTMNQLMLLFKLVICYIIVATKQALNSIEYVKLDEPIKTKNNQVVPLN